MVTDPSYIKLNWNCQRVIELDPLYEPKLGYAIVLCQLSGCSLYDMTDP